MPELPEQKKERLVADYGLSDYDAFLLTNQKEVADYFEECTKLYKNAKKLANWIMSDVSSEMNKRSLGILDLGLKPKNLAGLLTLLDNGTINGKMAKEILIVMIDTKKTAEEVVKEKDLSQIVDEDKLTGIIDGIIKKNPKSIEDYKNGKVNVLMFLVGQIMKETRGKANPKLVNELLKNKLK